MARWTPVAAGLSCPVAVSPRSGCVALLARAATGELFYLERDGGCWTPSQSLGVPVAQTMGSTLGVPVGWQLAACRGADGLELFAISPDGELLHMSGAPGRWGAFECLGSPAQVDGSVPAGLTSSPAVCRSDAGLLAVFVRGMDGELLQTTRDEHGWSGFESLGFPTVTNRGIEQSVPLVEPVAACRCGETGTAVFLRGVQGELLMKWHDRSGWTGYGSLGAPDVADPSYPAMRLPASLMGPPAACSWGPDRIDVFVRGPHAEILQKTWNGAAWNGFESLGMACVGDEAIPFTGAVTACTSGAGALDVVARAADGRLYHASWDGTWEHDASG
jgi:hypothetical protein